MESIFPAWLCPLLIPNQDRSIGGHGDNTLEIAFASYIAKRSNFPRTISALAG